MPAAALLLLFASAAMHALWNFLLKRAEEKFIAMGWQALLTGLFAALAMPFAGLPPKALWGIALLSALLETAYFLLLCAAYGGYDFSLTYPIARGAAPALLVLWTSLFLQERFTPGGSIGLALIIAGIVFIGWTANPREKGKKPQLGGVFAALSVALTISLYTFVDGFAVRKIPALPYGLFLFTLIPFFTTPYLIRKYGWASFARTWKSKREVLLASGVLGLAAYLLALRAYSFAPLSYSGAIREVSAVIGAFLGWKFLNEPMGGNRMAGAAVVFVGVLTIAIFG